jgi:hypothetical protein
MSNDRRDQLVSHSAPTLALPLAFSQITAPVPDPPPMPSNGPPQHDPEWLQSQWNELSDILSVSDPDQVVDQVRELQDQVDTLTDQQEALVEAGMKDSEQALRMIENMADQLEELYAERISDA